MSVVETAHAQWNQNRRKAAQRWTAKLSTSYRKSMSLNLFPVTDLRPEVELMHLLHMRRHYCHVWNRRHWTDSEFTLTLAYLVLLMIQWQQTIDVVL